MVIKETTEKTEKTQINKKKLQVILKKTLILSVFSLIVFVQYLIMCTQGPICIESIRVYLLYSCVMYGKSYYYT